MNDGYWFTSDLFEIKKGEDEATNPLRYGEALANWLAVKLSEHGYDTDVIAEDWGWCVMCDSKDYLLWVGCGSMLTEELEESYDEDLLPRGSDVVWHVFAEIEVPFFRVKTLMRKWIGSLDLKAPLATLKTTLRSVLENESALTLCESP